MRKARTKAEIDYDLESQSKVCSACNTRKDFSLFSDNKTKKGSPDGKSYVCKSCDSTRHKKWKQENTDHVLKLQRNNDLKNLYGISQEDYSLLLEKQEYKCAICGATSNKGGMYNKYFCVDHDHISNKVRGLLCHRCNVGLGCFSDKPELVRNALEYLESNE